MSLLSYELPCFYLKEANSVWRKVLHLGICIKVEKGVLLSSNEVDSFSFLHKGRIRLETVSLSGKPRTGFYVEEGSLFGEAGSVHYGKNSGVFYTLEQCTIYKFPNTLLEDETFICKYPELIANIIYTFKQKLNIFFSSLSESNEASPDLSVCRYLESFAVKYGKNTFRPDISQTDLAQMLGLHRSTICRVLKDLREEEILGEFSRYKLEILNRELLQSKIKELEKFSAY